MRSRAASAAVLLTMVLTACTPHPVGPARSFATYEGKAVTTAEAALSAVETVRLAASAGAHGRVTGPFLSVLCSEQEDALAGVEGTFGSIQPPDARSQRLRDDLGELLSRSLDDVADLRIDVRRGDLRPGRLLDTLADDAHDLRAFTEAHR